MSLNISKFSTQSEHLDPIESFDHYLKTTARLEKPAFEKGLIDIQQAISPSDDPSHPNSFFQRVSTQFERNLSEQTLPPHKVLKLAYDVVLDSLRQAICNISPLRLRNRTWFSISSQNPELSLSQKDKFKPREIATTCKVIATGNRLLRSAENLESYLTDTSSQFDPLFVFDALRGLGELAGIKGREFSSEVHKIYREINPEGIDPLPSIHVAISKTLVKRIQNLPKSPNNNRLLESLSYYSNVQQHFRLARLIDTCKKLELATRQIFFNSSLPTELENHIYSYLDLKDLETLGEALCFESSPIMDRISAKMSLLSINNKGRTFGPAQSHKYGPHAANILRSSGRESPFPEFYITPHIRNLKELILPNNARALSEFIKIITQISPIKTVESLVLFDDQMPGIAVVNDTLEKLLDIFPNLRFLQINDVSRVQERCLRRLPQTSIQALSLTKNFTLCRRSSKPLNDILERMASNLFFVSLKSFKGAHWKSIITLANANQVQHIKLGSQTSPLVKLLPCETPIKENTSLKILAINSHKIPVLDLLTFGAKMKALRELDLSSSDLIPSHAIEPSLTLDSVKRLNMAATKQHQRVNFITLLPQLPNLESIDLSEGIAGYCVGTLTNLSEIDRPSPNVKELIVSAQKLSMQSVAYLLRRFPNLEALNVSNNYRLLSHGSSLRSSTLLPDGQVIARNLKTLIMHGSSLSVTEELFAEIFAFAPNMTSLDLSHNRFIIPDQLFLTSDLSRRLSLKIERLILDGFLCKDRDFEQLILKFPNLKELSLVGANIRGDDLPLLVEKTEDLPPEFIGPRNVDRLPKVTSQIKTLNLNANCLTYEGFTNICVCCPHLETVKVLGNRAQDLISLAPFTTAKIEAFHRRFPNVTIETK